MSATDHNLEEESMVKRGGDIQTAVPLVSLCARG